VSKYTTELRYIYENEKLFPPLQGTLSLKNVLENYPLENESLKDETRKDSKTRREELNEKIINHYYFREIGFETVPRFLFALQRKLNEIMPLYNQMFKSVDLDINPIDNVNMTETFSHEISGSGKTTSNGTSSNSGTNTSDNENLNVESDTPPTELSEDDIKANKYASRTSHSKDTNSNSQSGTSSSNGEVNSTGNKTETYERKEFGSSKGYTFAQNIEQWRNIMINIEEEILNDLQDLFMNCW
jgi:hypothetical protein